MNILCLNTAFIQADMAVVLNNQKKLKKFDSSCKHSEHVMLGIDEMLSGTKIKDLDYMSVCVGTGSFTGIRIGISIAEGFKTANEKLKLIPINSFELVVNNLQQTFKNKYAVVLNALGGRYFVQYFKNNNAVSQPSLLTFEQIEKCDMVGLAEENLSFCTHFVSITPQSLLDITMKKIEQKDFVDNLIPLYLRKSQAEENLKKENQ